MNSEDPLYIAFFQENTYLEKGEENNAALSLSLSPPFLFLAYLLPTYLPPGPHQPTIKEINAYSVLALLPNLPVFVSSNGNACMHIYSGTCFKAGRQGDHSFLRSSADSNLCFFSPIFSFLFFDFLVWGWIAMVFGIAICLCSTFGYCRI